MQNIIYKPRLENLEITNYLDETLNRFQSLAYEIKDNFNKEDLEKVLLEDLPNSSQNYQKDIFIKDVINTCEYFYYISQNKKIRIQLQFIETNMCRLFHVDNIRQRLLCTYTGPGTEWLTESNLNREGLGKGDNKNIVINPLDIQRANKFDILILKGQKYHFKFKGAVHRSPPIENLKDKRILLKIDEL